MDNSLQQLCNLHLKNEEFIRESKIMPGEEFIKLGALLCTSYGFRPNMEKMNICKEILKKKTKKLSDFQGSVGSLVTMKMSMAQNPESYIDGVISIYNKFIEGKILSSISYVVTAMTIYDRCLANDMDIATVTAKTIATYEELTKGKIISDEWILPHLALMVTENLDLDNAIREINESSKILKKEHHFPGEIAITAAIFLTFSPKPVEDKVNDFCDLYEALKERKCHISSSKAISMYALFVDLKEDRDTLINNIEEVNEFLKGKKGYGKLFGTNNFGRIMAASLVLQNCTKSSAQSASIISTIVVEEFISLVLATIILFT